MSSLAQALIAYASSGGKDTGSLYRALSRPHGNAPPAYSKQTRPQPAGDGEGGGSGGPSYPVGHAGDMLILPTTWNGTHVTDGLGWGTRTAEDIMAKAGTPVGAPEPGVVKYFHPTGAQGGGSLLFDPDAPGRHDYWLGHLDAGAKSGTHLKRGGYLARVSSKHRAPHVHIDRGRQ